MSTIEKAAARLVAKANPIKSSIGEQSPRTQIESPGPTETTNAASDLVSKIDDQANRNEGKGAVSLSPASHFTCELDFEWLAENGFLVSGHNNPQQAQEFRRIKRPLLLNLQPKLAAELPLPPNVIFITSALAGEGKTFVSLNLALSLAGELDKRVLLVDSDAVKGDLSRWMGIHDETGLVDLLTSGSGYGESAIIDTNVDRLRVLPCGREVDNLDELYASDLMKTLIAGLASFDDDRILVIDGPPLIPTTEAAVLARSMGQVVMVVEANKTPQAAVEQAATQLEGCQCVSLLLNKASSFGASSYGYGYGQAASSTPPASAAQK